MIKGIRKTFIENIDTLTWMDTVTKTAAKDKVQPTRTCFNLLRVRFEDEDDDK